MNVSITSEAHRKLVAGREHIPASQSGLCHSFATALNGLTTKYIQLRQILGSRHHQTRVQSPEHDSGQLHMSLDNQKEAKGRFSSLELPKPHSQICPLQTLI